MDLQPKHHMMIHYPGVILRMGPLCQLSSLRYEAKHVVVKKMIPNNTCYKNIAKTLSKRHQMRWSSTWQSNIINNVPILGPKKKLLKILALRNSFLA